MLESTHGVSRIGMLFVGFLLAIVVVAPAARADVYDPAGWAPSVWSDKADYAPGELVTLSGSNWQPGEVVNIVVNDDHGSTWRRDVDVTADSGGAIADSFTLPDWFVAQYSVTATGAAGSTATTTFTDANLKVNGSFGGSTTESYTLTYRRWSAAGCGGTARRGDPSTAPVTTAAFTVPPAGENSVRLTAAGTSTGGRQFVDWTDTEGNVISTVPTVCADFPDGGTEKTYTANYAPNTAPTATAQTVTTNEDTVTPITLTGADDDLDSLSFKVMSLPSHGKLYAGSGTSGHLIVAGDLPYSVTGSQVTYDPDPNYNGPDSFSFKANDGTVDSAAAAVSIDVTPVNDAPSFSKGADETVDEDAGAQSVAGWATDIEPGPANESGQTVEFLVTNDDNTLFSSQPAIAPNGALTYTPAANQNGSATVSVRIRDDGGTANGGEDTSSTQTFTITVSSVNDAPAGADATVVTDEDSAYTFAAGDFGFSDNDDDPADELAAVKITTLPADGTLRLDGTAVTAGQDIAKSAIDANQLTFTPAANANGSPYTSFDFQVQDDGGTAHGGVDLDQSANTITIDVTSVNDAPAGADASVVTDEDSAYTFAAGDFGFSDPDDDPADELAAVKITTLPADGTLRLDGTAVTAGQDIAKSAIDADHLTFTPAANANATNYASFDFQVQDDGGTANDGVDLDQSANTITIDVTPVNDAPSFTKGADETVDEDAGAQSVAGWATDISPGPANESGQTVEFLVTNDDNTLFSSQPAIAPNGALSYTAAANQNGSATVSVRIRDDGGTANGGEDTSSTQTFTITVSSVNDAPAGADATVVTDEDSAYTFAAGDFGFSDNDDDPADELAAVKITTLPADGTLRLDGTAVTAGQFVTAAAIGADELTFTPAANQNGSPYTSFDFQVQDDGGTANDGVDLDQSANTITIDVTPVNDRPSAAATPDHLSIDEDAPAQTLSLTGSDEETGAGDLTFTITHAPAHGTLRKAASTLATGDTFTGSPQDVSYEPAADYNGADSFKFKITDTGDPVDCTGAPSPACDAELDSAEVTVPITIAPVNDAPVLHASGSPTLDDIVAQDSGNSGTSISVLIASGGAGYITDVDTDAVQGLAITGADTTNGSWQYSTDGGTTWSAIGLVTDLTARLLADDGGTTRLRFVPAAGFAGPVDPGVTFRAWDRTTGSNGDLADASSNGGTTAYSTDTDTASIRVQKRSTATSVSCSPASVVVSQGTTCTAVVTDTETSGTGDDPTGTVTFTTSASGSFSAASGSAFTAPDRCTLVSDGDPATSTSACKVTYTPSSAAAPNHGIAGAYGGSGLHTGSTSAPFAVTVSKRLTQTNVTCGNPVAVGQSATCTATVDDIDPDGTKSNPSGTATFTIDSSTGSFTGNPCTLQPVTGDSDSSTCSVSYKSTTVGVDNIHAAYGGSVVHATSQSTDPGSSGGLAVTFDPNAGFVTGGGTITSPQGAYTADPTLTGRANFGFVSKYQKGQSTPTGQTEFQFHSAKFNFHSELYDWLVTSGAKAQYKGTGKVNGAAGYSFLITAVDGQISGGGGADKFRIKVWNTTTDATVYDNKLGATTAFTDSLAQNISGGSIVIHAK